MANKQQFTTIDEYLQTFPDETYAILEKLRQTIQKVAPEAVEKISYGIPAFRLNNRNLIYFAGWKDHTSLYPIPVGDEAFQKELAPYVAGKGTVKFPLNKPIPYDLVEKIVRFRIKEGLEEKR